MQASNPTLGAGLQDRDLLFCEVQAHRPVEKGRRLGWGEAQIVNPHFGHLSPGTQTRHRQGWIDAGGDDQVHLGGQMLEQKVEHAVDGLRLDQVIIVEDQNSRDGQQS